MTLPVPDPLLLAAVPGVLAIGLWALVDLQRFVLFVVLGAMIFPYALVQPRGSQVAMADVLLLVALAAWLIAGSARRAPRPLFSSNSFLLPALLFVGVNAESLLWSVDPAKTVQFTIQLVEIVVLFPLVFASIPRSTDAIRHGLLVFIGLTCLLSIVYLPYAPGAFPGGVGKNTIGSFLGAGLVMAYALLLGERRVAVQRLLGLAVLVEFAGLFASASRGSILGALVAVLAATMLLRRGRVITVVMVIIAGTAYLAVNGTASGADLTGPGSYDSSQVRTHSFSNAVAKIKEEPILGTGGGTYSDYLPQFGIGLPDPNNIFLLTWAELGILGLLALGFLLYRAGGLLVSVRKLPGAAAVPAVAAGCAGLSMLVHFQVDVTWTRGTASLMFAMIGLMLATKRLAAVAEDEHSGSDRDATSLRPELAAAGSR